MSRRITLEVNTEIRATLLRYDISLHDGITYLLCLYYGTDPSFIPKELERKILTTKIVTKDYENDVVKWNIPLFEEGETGFEWISEWMDLFKKVNPERRGTKSIVLQRMKRFFVNNPSIRSNQVIDATKAYLLTVTDPIYCKKSHKFIYEQDGSSMLADYVSSQSERVKKANNNRDDVI